MRVLIAPDKFKGSLTAAEAAEALAAGWRDGWPAGNPLTVEQFPLADGGEGTAEAFLNALGGERVSLTVSGPMGLPVEAFYVCVEKDGERLAIIEMSSASGFGLVPDAERDLPRANTFGTGELLRHAVINGCVDRVIMGIGGSATNDGGVGMAAALGWKFFDADGRLLAPVPADLSTLARIEAPVRKKPLPPIVVACDVSNPLLGPLGATRVYGPQKGLRGEDEAQSLENILTRLADVAARTLGRDCRDLPGAGAAGGLGFGLMTFCHAELRPGFELISDALGLPAVVVRADLVLTGEGSLDYQTLHGKTPAGVASLARRYGKRIVAFGGRVDPESRPALAACFDELISLRDAEPDLDAAQCMARAAALLRKHAAVLAARVAAAP